MPDSAVAFRMPARINRGGRVTVAAVVEFSETGLLFESTSLCPPGEEITVSVDTEAGTFELPAKTEWWRMEPFATFEQMRFSNGCALPDPGDAWRTWVEQTRNGLDGKAAEETRYGVVHRVRIADGPPRFEQTENLTTGGMYLATPVPYEEGRELTFELDLAGEPLRLKGRVAYCLDEAGAAQKGRRAGVGIQFVDLTNEAKARLEQHLGRIALHRSFRQRTELDDVPEAGSLATYLVPEVLLAMMRRRASGMLHLEHAGIFKDVYFVSGQVVWVDSSDPTEAFSGREEDKNVAHAQRLQSAVSWFDGAYSFDNEAPAPRAMVQLNGPELVIDSVRERYKAELVCAWMGLTRETVMRHTHDERLEPSGMLRDMLGVLAEPTSVESLMTMTGLTFEAIVPLLFGAIVAGWLDVHQDQNEAMDAELERAKRIAEFWQDGPLDVSRVQVRAEGEPELPLPEETPEAALPELAAEAAPELPELEASAAADDELPEIAASPEEHEASPFGTAADLDALPELELAADDDLPEVAPQEDLPEVPAETDDLPELAVMAASDDDLPEVNAVSDEAPLAAQPRPTLRTASLGNAAPAAAAPEPENHARTFIAAGDVLMRQGDYAGAFKHYSLALAYEPNNALALGRLEQLKPLILEQERARLKSGGS